MRGAIIAAAALAAALALGSCAGAPAPAAAAPKPGNARILPVVHIDGFGTPTDELAWIAWEFEAQTFVRYQVVYISCTCRQESVNKQSMLFLEIAKGKSGGRIHRIFFDFWGDSPVFPSGIKRAEIETGYVPKFVNATRADIKAIDTISGATVTTINLKQITDAVLAYHDAKYKASTEAPLYDVDATSAATEGNWSEGGH